MPDEVKINRAQLNQLLDAITERAEDAMNDLRAVVQCVQTTKDYVGAQSCILRFLQTGQNPTEQAITTSP